MKKLTLFVTVLTLTLFFSSCATIFTGTRDSINFNTEPPGAMVFINGIEECRTPCTVRVKRDINAPDVEFRLDGYQTRLITLSQEFNIVSVLNLGNLLGWAVDVLTGAIMKYDRRSYNLELTEATRTSLLNPHKIEIDTEEKVVSIYIFE